MVIFGWTVAESKTVPTNCKCYCPVLVQNQDEINIYETRRTKEKKNSPAAANNRELTSSVITHVAPRNNNMRYMYVTSLQRPLINDSIRAK